MRHNCFGPSPEEVGRMLKWIKEKFPDISPAKQRAQAQLTTIADYRCTQEENMESFIALGIDKNASKVLAKSASREFGAYRYVSPRWAGEWLLKSIPNLTAKDHTALAVAMTGGPSIPSSR